MKKIKEHFSNYGLIYLILFTCAVVIFVTYKITNKEEEVEYFSTDVFNVLSLKEANKLFDSKDAKILVISVKTCSATTKYVDSLVIAQAKYDFATNYLELSELDTESEDFEELLEHLDFPITMKGEEGTLAKFLGNTPMTIIIKNKKIVYAFIGSLNTSVLESLVTKYDVK